MKNLDSSSCLVCEDDTRGLRWSLHRHDTRGLRWSLHRHVSWFVVATRVSSQSKQNAGCTKHIFGVGQGAPKGVSTAARVGQGVVQAPRRALEIQPYRGVGQCV